MNTYASMVVNMKEKAFQQFKKTDERLFSEDSFVSCISFLLMSEDKSLILRSMLI